MTMISTYISWIPLSMFLRTFASFTQFYQDIIRSFPRATVVAVSCILANREAGLEALGTIGLALLVHFAHIRASFISVICPTLRVQPRTDHLLLALALASANRRWSEHTWLSSTDRANNRDHTTSGIGQ